MFQTLLFLVTDAAAHELEFLPLEKVFYSSLSNWVLDN
jgi:hypothetical protein